MENDHIAPIKLVPKLFLDFVGFPQKSALIWCLSFFICLLIGSQNPWLFEGDGNSESTSQTPAPYDITITAPDPCTISAFVSISSSTLTLSNSSNTGSTITKEMDDVLVFRSASQAIVATLKAVQTEDGTSIQIFDAQDALQYIVKPDDDGYKILDKQRAPLSRVKFKEDKFNIYNASGDRLYYGKEKKGSILIRNDGGSDLGWISASNSPPLPQIAPLCLPIDEPARALLYFNELRKAGTFP